MNLPSQALADLQSGNSYFDMFPRVGVYGYVQKRLSEWVSMKWLYRRTMTIFAKKFSKMANETEEKINKLHEVIDNCNFDPDKEFDPDGTLIPILEDGEKKGKNALRSYRELLSNLDPSLAHELAQQTKRLCKVTEEGLDLVQDFRWKILIHNGVLSPDETESCHSAAEFRAALNELQP